MKDKQTEINLEDIMKKIRLEVTKKKRVGIYPLDLEINLQRPITSSTDDLNFLLCQLDRYSQIKIKDLELSKKPLVGSLINIVKKIINKMLYWYIHSFVQQVDIFNSYVKLTIEKIATDKNDEFLILKSADTKQPTQKDA